jgi:hypothetical protein
LLLFNDSEHAEYRDADYNIFYRQEDILASP